MVRDPRDFEMPKASTQILVEDPYSNQKLYIDSHQYSKIYAAEGAHQEAFVRNSFEKARLGFISLRTDQDFQEPLLKYFKKRLSLVR